MQFQTHEATYLTSFCLSWKKKKNYYLPKKLPAFTETETVILFWD
jgi:hypothetical protein